MNCGSPGRWPFHGMAAAACLLVLCLHLQGSASRCIEESFTEDLQPLPPGVQRNSLPSGLLQPDVSSPGRRECIPDGGDTRIVGGGPATFGGQGGGSSTGGPGSPGSFGGQGGGSSTGGSSSPGAFGGQGGGSSTGGSSSPGAFGGQGGGSSTGGSSSPGKPNRPGLFGRPLGPIFGGKPSSPSGVPGGPAQYGGGVGPFGYGGGYDNRQGFPRPVWKRPGFPYIPTAEERGGGYIPIRNEPSRLYPYGVPYGGGAAGASTYGGGSMASGPRGTYDGSYGPIPGSMQPGGQRDGGDKGNPCTPNC